MELNCNIVENEKQKKIAVGVLKKMKDSIVKTIGPGGRSAIVASDPANVLITKDGFHVVRDIFFNDPIANVFATFYRDLSEALVGSTGDGSTSCLVAAYYFYTFLEELLENNEIIKKLRPKKLIESIKSSVNMILKEMDNYTKPVSDDLHELKKIAYVSLNNNEKIGDMIYEIYHKIGIEGFINVKLGNDAETKYSLSDGFMIECGRMDESFVNNGNNESELDDSAILIFGKAVNSEEFINYCIGTLSEIKKQYDAATAIGQDPKYKSLTVIAPSYGRDFVSKIRALIANTKKMGYKINFNLIQYSLATEYDREYLYDVSLMCGATIINETEEEEGSLFVSLSTGEKKFKDPKDETKIITKSSLGNYLGFAKKVISTKKSTTFFDANENKNELEAERGRIKSELASIAEESAIKRKYELRKRLAIINKSLVTIYVGGVDEAARLNDKELIDDAVSACKSAIKSGYSLGCNLPIILSCINILENNKELEKHEIVIISSILLSFRNVYKEIILNDIGYSNKDDAENIINESIGKEKVYDLVNEEYTDENIISPIDTDKAILKHISSIISLILTSDQMIVRNTTEQFEI